MTRPAQQIGSPVVPLWAPVYGATFRIAVSRLWNKYADFSGRASRSEYWWAALFLGVTGVVVDLVAFASLAPMNIPAASSSQGVSLSPLFFLGFGLVMIWGLVFIVPFYAVTARRLHDTNRSGRFILLAFIPYVGGIILLVFVLGASNPLGERFDKVQSQ